MNGGIGSFHCQLNVHSAVWKEMLMDVQTRRSAVSAGELIPLFLAELFPDGVETSRFVWSVYANNFYLFDFDLLYLLWSSHDRFFLLQLATRGSKVCSFP